MTIAAVAVVRRVQDVVAAAVAVVAAAVAVAAVAVAVAAVVQLQRNWSLAFATSSWT
jgi:hypothetical protein